MAEGTLRNIGAVLRAYRSKFDIDLRQFAEETGVSYSTLSRIERGGVPDVDTWTRLMVWLIADRPINTGGAIESKEERTRKTSQRA